MLADEMGWDGEVSGSWTWWVIWWEEGDGGCGACNVIYTVVGNLRWKMKDLAGYERKF